MTVNIPVVYAMGTDFVNLPNGGRAKVQKGTHWPADDPAVHARPELFTTDVRYGLMYTTEPAGYDEPADTPVEQATAAPGEKRNTRRG